MEPLSEYRCARRVQFYETDAAGIVHFSWYFRYMEEAEHALWRAVGLSVASPDSKVGWPRVSASFDYHRALHFEDEFDIRLRVAEVGTRTIRFACALTRSTERVATGALTIACVTRSPGERMKAVPIPADIKARFRVAPEGDE
jgi:YbgC/YbaW family acyl-CoA thioester hydrolase